jgi:poly(A) polymerase Pap1/uncharacterized protein (UPF0248 family)
MTILNTLGQNKGNFHAHMTVGQSEDAKSDTHAFLLNKVERLPVLEWDVEELSILVRERMQVDGSPASQMKLWGTINLSTGTVTRQETPQGFYDKASSESTSSVEATASESGERDRLQTKDTFYYDDELQMWLPLRGDAIEELEEKPRKLVVSSYNVLGEFTWPPSQARYPLVIKNILSARASAEVLVLQEVTDDFLSYLLGDESIRDVYPYSSHGPSDQADVEPLPSLLNLVILSKWAFDWEWVSFRRKHKGSVVAKFRQVGSTSLPTVVAAVHLNCGLTDGAVAAKKIDIQNILTYLSKSYPSHPSILAGDFNISTSSLSIDAALKKKAISSQSAAYLVGFEKTFAEAGLVDAWTVSRFEVGDDSDGEPDKWTADESVQGEQGATYDPLTNEVAGKIVGSGYNMRPQRYDRILVRGEGVLSVTRFNRFGFLKEVLDGEAEPSYASDHWGVRTELAIGMATAHQPSQEISNLVAPVHLQRAPESLAAVDGVKMCLSVPTEEEIEKRKAVFNLLKKILVETPAGNADNQPVYHKSRASVVVVPVGSYGLGVWTSSSDIDCLCIGPFSTKTFFALASQRLRKASDEGVKILRRVKANTGTMLELSIQGVKVDLQYCAATSVAEHWPHVLKVPASDPIWTLPTQTLSKLKATRDLDYLRRSVPDLAKFRLAHRFIRAWASARGIFSARFGFLGGMQISLLLARVYKMVAAEAGTANVSVPDLLSTFFSHYAAFDWRTQLVFDPFFHRHRLPYTRTAREPLAILGYFPPALNTSAAATVPSVRAIAAEFRRAATLLSSGAAHSWATLLEGSEAAAGRDAAEEFLHAHKSYVRIDLQYWGLSEARGARYVGWLESRLVLLLVDLARRVTAVHSRIWPARFVETLPEDEDESARDYQACYLIGLTAEEDEGKDKEEREEMKRLAAGALQTVLGRFEELIRGDEQYFDAKSCWMSAAVVSRRDLKKLAVDAREWGEYSPGEGQEESEDEAEDEDDGFVGSETSEEADSTEDDKTKMKSKKKAGKKSVVVPRMEPGRKLRSAADVMNRLRWDPVLASRGEYIVGYEDRFVGPQERSLDQWKTEQTDEEFIPQHRILYFRRKDDGVKVWDRKTRKDEIFGSGAT